MITIKNFYLNFISKEKIKLNELIREQKQLDKYIKNV